MLEYLEGWHLWGVTRGHDELCFNDTYTFDHSNKGKNKKQQQLSTIKQSIISCCFIQECKTFLDEKVCSTAVTMASCSLTPKIH